MPKFANITLSVMKNRGLNSMSNTDLKSSAKAMDAIKVIRIKDSNTLLRSIPLIHFYFLINLTL